MREEIAEPVPLEPLDWELEPLLEFEGFESTATGALNSGRS
jgi:hypothetical protein